MPDFPAAPVCAAPGLPAPTACAAGLPTGRRGFCAAGLAALGGVVGLGGAQVPASAREPAREPAGELAGEPASAPAPARARRRGPAFLLARDWPAGADPAGFLVSEKLDGVRARWDGQRLRLRGGGTVAAPAAFTQRLPPQPLDGELWLGRGRFDELSGQVRRLQPDPGFWAAVQYRVFELPDAGGRFSERAAALQALCRQVGWPALQAEPQRPVAGRAALQHWLDGVVAAGGEGLMLHRADAPPATGRGPWLYKHKPLHDADAEVIAHLPGLGRHAGRLGALQVRSREGVVFALGTGLSDAQRSAPPAVGRWVTYTHRGFTPAGVPRFAAFLRLAAPA